MKLKYKGTDERVFPTIGITVKPDDEFDAPEGFSHPDCVPTGSYKPTTTTKSASSDTKAGE